MQVVSGGRFVRRGRPMSTALTLCSFKRTNVPRGTFRSDTVFFTQKLHFSGKNTTIFMPSESFNTSQW